MGTSATMNAEMEELTEQSKALMEGIKGVEAEIQLINEGHKDHAKLPTLEALLVARERRLTALQERLTALQEKELILMKQGMYGPAHLERLAKVEQAVETMAQRLKRPRPEADTGVASGTVAVSVAGADEMQLWEEHVKGKVACEIVNINSLVAPARPVMAALRWLTLLTEFAPTFRLAQHFQQRSRSGDEAAASGQPDIDFAEEDKSMQDKAREDLRGLVRNKPAAPQEVKREYGLAGSGDPSGIQRNRAGFAKLLKCICDKYKERTEHLVTLAARIEAVWIARFTFGQQGQQGQQSGPGGQGHEGQGVQPDPQQGQQQGQQQGCDVVPPCPQQPEQPGPSTPTMECGCDNLASVHVAPRFPTHKNEAPDGVICQDINIALHELLRKQGSTLADLLVRASVPSTINGQPAAPPGFQLLVQYVDKLCCNFGIQIVSPTAVYSGSTGGAQGGEVVDLSLAEVVHLGRKSLVLRMPDADTVIKVATGNTVKRELAIHRAVDSPRCLSLRPSAGLRHGLIQGAGVGLAFLELQYWCTRVSGNMLQTHGLLHGAWDQAEAAVERLHQANILHRDIKPSNFLMHEGRLLLNDFDVSCHAYDIEATMQRPVGTMSFWSPRCDVDIPGWRYDTDDDWMGLALTFANWLGAYDATFPHDTHVRPYVKLGAVRTLLAPAFVSHLPASFRTRMVPVYNRVLAIVEGQQPA